MQLHAVAYTITITTENNTRTTQKGRAKSQGHIGSHPTQKHEDAPDSHLCSQDHAGAEADLPLYITGFGSKGKNLIKKEKRMLLVSIKALQSSQSKREHSTHGAWKDMVT